MLIPSPIPRGIGETGGIAGALREISHTISIVGSIDIRELRMSLILQIRLFGT